MMVQPQKCEESNATPWSDYHTARLHGGQQGASAKKRVIFGKISSRIFLARIGLVFLFNAPSWV